MIGLIFQVIVNGESVIRQWAIAYQSRLKLFEIQYYTYNYKYIEKSIKQNRCM